MRSVVDLDLDGAGRQVRVDGLGGAGDDLALRLEDELVADLLRELRRLGRVLRVDHELRDPGAVAEVDEDEAAVVAAARGPAGERLARADVLLAELAAHDVAPGHADSLPTTSARASGSSACPGRRSTAPSGADDDGRRGAEAGRLGQLALQRAAGVVGVDGERRARAARRACARPRCRGAPSSSAKKTSIVGGVGGDARILHRDAAAARARRRSRRPGVGGPPISSTSPS